MKQPSLFDLDTPAPTGPVLVCSFNEPWIGEHPRCAAYADELEAQFWALVARGELDVAGYSKNERKAQMKRQRAALT